MSAKSDAPLDTSTQFNQNEKLTPVMTVLHPSDTCKRTKRKKKHVSTKTPAAAGTRSMIGPNQVRSRTKSSPSFSMGTSEREKPKQPISPGPVFYPKPTSKWLGDAPSYSFGGEYGNRAHVSTFPPAQGSLTKEQMELLDEDAKTTPIPNRFKGAGSLLDYPGPGQYRVHAQTGFARCKSGQVQVRLN